jgi:hypothetical protein
MLKKTELSRGVVRLLALQLPGSVAERISNVMQVRFRTAKCKENVCAAVKTVPAKTIERQKNQTPGSIILKQMNEARRILNTSPVKRYEQDFR